jgi:hypothetical protein
MTRKQFLKLFKQKNCNKFINLIEGSEQIIDEANSINLLEIDNSFRTDSDIETNGLKKKDKNKNNLNDENIEGLFEVEEIISKRRRRGKIEYQVKWKDYPIDQSTWEKESNFNESSAFLIQEFERKRRDKKRKLENNKKEFIKNLKRKKETAIDSCKTHDKSSEKVKNRFSKRLLRAKKQTHKIEKNGIFPTDEESSERDSLTENKDYDASYTSSNFNYKSSYSLSNLSPYTISDITSSFKPKINEIYNKKNNSMKNLNKRKENLSKINKNNNEINNNQGQFVLDSLVGDIKIDKIKKIISAYITDPTKVELSCLVEFEQRPNGIIPEPRKYSSSLVRFYAPQCLIDFYQSRICINGNGGNKNI